ncbi:MAG: hypothetical protein IKU10_04360, partial [Clostridia bacterium]|nr:hypothetical protein [Clostridia bacterium]
MKKRICYVLILCLLVSLFAGCTEKQPATSTDVTPFESNDTQTQEFESIQEQSLADEPSEQAQLN